MAYCTLADINALLPQVPFSASSKPSEASVQSFIEQVANDMDMIMGNIGYATPVASGVKGLAWLKATNAFGAAGQAQVARDAGVNTAVTASSREMKNIWLQRYDDRMKALGDPQDPTELPDAPRTNEQLQKQPENVLRSFAQGVTDDPSYDPNVPVVSRYQTL